MAPIPPFAPILAAAVIRCGGEAALEERLIVPKNAAELAAVPDDRYLSTMCLRIFRAGLKHDLVDAKWPAFERLFHGFDPNRVVAMSDDDLDRAMADPSIIRHGGKIKAIRDNAAALRKLAASDGSMGRWLAAWGSERTTALWADLAKRFSQLGGNSGPYFLRMVGKDTFVLTDDVVHTLIASGALAAPPKGMKDMAQVQAVFDAWVAESRRPLCQISQIAALARGPREPAR